MPKRKYATKKQALKAQRQQTKEWHKANPLAVQEINRRYREAHKEYYKEYMKQYAMDHKEEVLANSRKQYYDKTGTPEGRAAYNKYQRDLRNATEESKEAARVYNREYQRLYRARKRAEKAALSGLHP